MPLDSLIPFADEDGITLFYGDCLDVLPLLPENSIDALVTDPPAGIEFMGKAWDSFRVSPDKPSGQQTEEWATHADSPFARRPTPRFTGKQGTRSISIRDNFVIFMTAVMEECFRVMKPGAHGLVWAIPRTSHWTALALEDAGFEVRDRISHLFGSGFPKSLDVSKAIDSAAGAERETVGTVRRWGNGAAKGRAGQYANDYEPTIAGAEKYDPITLPATDEAKQWEGWGTALKPACEDWWLIRKPVDGTVAKNILEHGTGGLNIAGCRLGTGEDKTDGGCAGDTAIFDGGISERSPVDFTIGRWPANVVLSHSEDCELIGTRTVESNGHYPDSRGEGGLGTSGHAGQAGLKESFTSGEIVETWRCVESCPIRLLDKQSGLSKSAGGCLANIGGNIYGAGNGLAVSGLTPESAKGDPGFGDFGGASRFFYCAKSSVEDREQGLEDLESKQRDESRKEGNPGGDNPRNRGLSPRKNHHPTVKSTDLMRWLVRLITPPGGIVLDPFAGSGSTGKACAYEGFKAILIERELEYCEIAKRRVRLQQKRLF